VLKRFFTADGLLAELREAGCGGGSLGATTGAAAAGATSGAAEATVFAGTWFVAVRVALR